MNKYYYFTESKWYGPVDLSSIDFLKNFDYFKFLESLPSGDSLIPEFAGMVKEENKDFKFKLEQTIFLDQQQWQEMSRSEKDECFTKKAVHIKPEDSLNENELNDVEIIAKKLSKESTAPDKETPDWMISDIRRGLIHGILYERQQTAVPVAEEGKQTFSEWIELEEGNPLPDYDQPVLWLCQDGNMFVDALDKDGNPWVKSCTHWRHLPELPNT